MAANIVISRPPVATTKLGILGLPVEILKETCSHCSQSDLICLALVCRKFHELAASQLYRNFHIVFPDEDDPTFDSPIDGLASGLDTFITSEYNYAIHLRDLSLDTLSAGGRAEQAYRPYLYKVSCGKFMNTMLLLTLRKAKALESFKWNIRVELSRRVYKALHDIKSLKHFHVRMQSGHSSYETPPPLPWNADYSVNSDTASHADNVWSTAGAPSVLYGAGTNAPLSLNGVSPATGPFGINIPQQYTTYAPPPFIPLPTINPHVMPPPIPTLKPPFRNKVPRKHDGVKEPLTIAGLHKLQTICILDIDNLDIVPEIQTCIQQSSSQLRKLKLSFSDYLASQARKPKVELDPNESDDDDEFQVVPMTTSYDDGNGPVKAFRAQEERKAQESVLGRIFQVEPFIARTLGLARKHRRREKTKEPGEQASGSRQVLFLSAIREASKRLTESIPNLASDASKQQEILDLITAASRLYVDDVEKDALRTSQGVYIPPSWFSEGITKPRTTSASEDDKQHPESYAEDKAVDPTPRTNLHRERDNDIEPEDIDVAKPEDQFIDDSLDEGSDDTTSRNDPVPDSTPPTAIATNPSHGTPSQVNSVAPGVIAVENADVCMDDNKPALDSAEQSCNQPESTHMGPPMYESVQHEIHMMEAELEDAGKHDLQIPYDDEELKLRVGEYARETRGIALKSLSIHLIPLKASVIGRAIDLRTLTRITLLNVGNQAPVWNLMAKENAVQSLPLCKIYTDNVSSSFLHLVSQLETVQELFLLERSAKHKPESFAAKTEITLNQIRRAVLKKHMSTMKRLMIKNQNETKDSWDMDEKCMQLICKRGKQLEELAVATGIRAIHAFLQHLTGLVNLRALHIISFRVDDTCLSVMRETRRFIVDTVSHYPEMRLEWIAMGDDHRADRIVRRPEGPKTSRKAKTKGKGKEVTVTLMESAPSSFPIMPTNHWNDDSSESEDGEDENDTNAYLKLDLIEAICFYDIWGVRIFKKEVVAGRL